MINGSELEGRVVELIRDALQVEAPAPDADLIDLGLLDSLAIVTLLAEIEIAFGIELPLDDFEVDCFRTVERMAQFLAATVPSEGAA
jgi:acyl carrier protein